METYGSSEYLKVLTDTVDEWGSSVMYVWYASLDWDKAYTWTPSNSEPIRKIRKIVTTWNYTETYYAEWDSGFKFVRNDRASLNYI